MEHLKKINKLSSRSELTEADAIKLGREIKRRMVKRYLGTEKKRLLKQGLVDARKGRIVQAKENYTKYVPNDKPLSETNPYMRDPKLRDKMILVSAASSAAIEGIRVPQKILAKGLRPGWKPRRPKRRS